MISCQEGDRKPFQGFWLFLNLRVFCYLVTIEIKNAIVFGLQINWVLLAVKEGLRMSWKFFVQSNCWAYRFYLRIIFDVYEVLRNSLTRSRVEKEQPHKSWSFIELRMISLPPGGVIQCAQKTNRTFAFTKFSETHKLFASLALVALTYLFWSAR